MVRNSVLFRKNFPRNLYNRCDGFEEGFSIDILHQERKALQTYLYDNRWWLLLFNGLLLFIWGPWIANTAPRIDTEVLINTPYTPYNWLDIGRQGGILTECLFGLRWFNPIFFHSWRLSVDLCCGYVVWISALARRKEKCGSLFSLWPALLQRAYYDRAVLL